MAAAESITLRGTLLEGEPMACHTTWRVGGPADRYYKPADLEDLANFLALLDGSEPLYWVGLGSNLLVRDGGLRGTVIATSGLLNGMGRSGANTVRVEAGVACAKVARFCAREGLAGAEFLNGIPGTMGGALAMNAGCFGGETWNIVESVEVIDHSGAMVPRKPDEYRIGYRHVEGPKGEWFVAATLRLEPGDSGALQDANRELLKRRGDSQPTQLPNAGSVFRNPEGDYAARLIETAGLKGSRVGGAEVSEKHANFIVNINGATAEDIEQLIERVHAEVLRVHGVNLEREVHIIGEREVSHAGE